MTSKAFNLNLPLPKPQTPYKYHANPPYLLHQMTLKPHNKPTTAKPHSTHQIIPLIDDPRAKTTQSQPRPRFKDNSYIFSAFDHKMKLITKGVYETRKSTIRSPKHLLSGLSFSSLEKKPQKKRDILSKTGSLNRTNLQSLMYYETDNKNRKTNFYTLRLGKSTSSFKNYMYKKPDILCEQVFMNETIKPNSKHKLINKFQTGDLETCIENLHSLKKHEGNQDFNGINDDINHENLVRNESKKKDIGVFQETIEEIQSFLLKTPYFLKKELEKTPFPLDISDIQAFPEGLEVFMRSGSCKEPIMLKEFNNLWSLSQSVLRFLEKIQGVTTPQNILISVNMKKSLFLGVVKHCFSGFKSRNSLINYRILLALGYNPENPLGLITVEKYFKLVRLYYIVDHSQEELIEFAMKFFRIDKDCKVEKSEFFRLLKILTEPIDKRYEEGAFLKRKTLFENFLENFYMTGILGKDSNFVDFEKFRRIYNNYQMNIYDLIDLIFGRV